MIFVGDIALPYKNAIKFENIPNHFYSKNWFGNLEGSIVTNDNNMLQAVYNNNRAIEYLGRNFNYKGFALANNHIFDTGSFESTVGFLNSINIPYCGVGKNINDANKELIIEEDGIKLVIVNFGWEVIQCEITTGNKIGVNPLKKNHVLNTLKCLIDKYPDAKIIPFMHWSYELEAQPQPFERELSRNMIDLGVYAVIGCHSHCIGEIETYKNKPIIYSLGNWMFKQNHYFRKMLKFPDFCNLQLAFEIDFKNDNFYFHFFRHKESRLEYIKSEKFGGDRALISNYNNIESLSNVEYKNWYKRNHFHKNKGLPIFYWEDGVLNTYLKIKLVKFRDLLLKFILRKGK